MTSIRSLVVLGSLVGGALGCGDNAPAQAPDAGPADAGIDAPPDPFAGMFDGPEDFPRTGCRAGALAGFARIGLWPTIGLRTAIIGGALTTFIPDFLGERAIEHLLTADDLFIRRSDFNPNSGRWSTRAIDICDVTADGTLIGHQVSCFSDRCFTVRPFTAARFQRLAGESEGDGVTLLGELRIPMVEAGGHPLNVRVEGDVAYVAMGSSGLRTISIANPAAPVLLGHYQPPSNYFNDVKLLTVAGRRYAVMAGQPSEVIDVTVPASPQLVAPITVSAHTLFIEGTHAYLVDGVRSSLWIYDLANPRAPVQRQRWDATGQASFSHFHDLHVTGGIAYLSTAYQGLTVVDVRDPTAPRLLGASPEDPDGRYWHSPWVTEIGGRKLALNGDEGGSPRLAILDVDPASPTFLDAIGSWGIPGEISMHNVMARGDKAYFVHYQHGLRVLDLADPTAPRQVGYFNTWREADAVAAYYAGAIGLDLDPARRRIYVADTQRGLLVLGLAPALMP